MQLFVSPGRANIHISWLPTTSLSASRIWKWKILSAGISTKNEPSAAKGVVPSTRAWAPPWFRQRWPFSFCWVSWRETMGRPSITRTSLPRDVTRDSCEILADLQNSFVVNGSLRVSVPSDSTGGRRRGVIGRASNSAVCGSLYSNFMSPVSASRMYRARSMFTASSSSTSSIFSNSFVPDVTILPSALNCFIVAAHRTFPPASGNGHVTAMVGEWGTIFSSYRPGPTIVRPTGDEHMIWLSP